MQLAVPWMCDLFTESNSPANIPAVGIPAAGLPAEAVACFPRFALMISSLTSAALPQAASAAGGVARAPGQMCCTG